MKKIKLETHMGDIVLELDDERAPLSVAYFCERLAAGDYKGSHFYRIVRSTPDTDDPPNIDVVQGGVGWERVDDLPSVPLEVTKDTGILHKDGTVSLARSKPDVSASEFFICIGDQPRLDYGGTPGAGYDGFAAFGQVVEGMDVVRAIHGSPANSLPPDGNEKHKNEFLDDPVDILVTEI